MKKNVSLIFLILFSLSSFAQSAFDKALKDISSDLAEKLSTKEKKKVVVLYITDINKSATVAGKYLADNISYNIVNDSRNFVVFDRDNLSEIAAAKSLMGRGYITVDEAKDLGKTLSVDAIIVGNYTVLSNTIKLSIKALDSNNGFVIAASMKDLPLNSDAGALLGINVTTDGENNNSNRGFNGQPINSNEQINNPETVNKECALKHTGDYCFTNNTSKNLSVIIDPTNMGASKLTLSPGQTQCFYSLHVGAHYYQISETVYFTGYTAGSGMGTPSRSQPKYNAQGQINIEQCKSKTFSIK